MSSSKQPASADGVRKIELNAAVMDPLATATLEADVARRLGVIPVSFEGDRLLVAMTDAKDVEVLNEIAALTGTIVEPVIATKAQLAKAILAVYGEASADDVGSRKGSGRVGLDMDDTPTLDLHEVLELVLDNDASDLHLTNGLPPTLRIDGELLPIEGYPVLEPMDLQRVAYGMLSQKQREKFEENLELDFSYALPGKARFRVNLYQQRGAIGAAFRLVPFAIRSAEDLGLPAVIEDFARIPRGLVVVTGPTGSGKSTTLAALVDVINRERAVHIMTVEDPIEFLHPHRTAVVNQREVGQDTHTFANALKHVLRQDPDVILVGEMRDIETMQMAVTAAETGHLVFATLHTQDAAQTVDRIIDAFPPEQQQQIRTQLALSLQGVVAQQLLPLATGQGRAVVAEILMVTPAVRNLIREGKTHQLYSVMQAGAQFGMQTMDAALAGLVESGTVEYAVAKERCHNAEEFARLAGSRAPASGRVRSIG